MNHRRFRHHSQGRRDVMSLLAKARPAALDADEALQNRWPASDQLISAAGRSDAVSHPSDRVPRSSADPARRTATHHRWARTRRGKLFGALSSAVVTAIVVAVAVIVGATMFGSKPAPGHPHPVTSGHSSATAHPAGPGGIPISPFHPLPLAAGWRGDLGIAVRNGVVYLTGHADGRDARGSVIASLPSGLRPAETIELPVSLGKSGLGAIKIAPDGEITPISPNEDVSHVSFDGISFPIGS